MPFSGIKLQKLMSQRCYSINRLCAETGISLSVFIRHRNGNVSPSVDHIDRYVTVLKCTPNDLWELPDPRDVVAVVRTARFRETTLRGAKEKALLQILQLPGADRLDAPPSKMIESVPPADENEPNEDVIRDSENRPRLTD